MLFMKKKIKKKQKKCLTCKNIRNRLKKSKIYLKISLVQNKYSSFERPTVKCLGTPVWPPLNPVKKHNANFTLIIFILFLRNNNNYKNFNQIKYQTDV